MDPQGDGLYGVPLIDPYINAFADPSLSEAKAEPSLKEATTAPAPAPATPPPAPDRRAEAAKDRARRQGDLLSEIHLLVPVADNTAARRLQTEDLSGLERRCIGRVRATIAYGASLHNRDEEGDVEELLQHCITLRQEHLQAVKSTGPLWTFRVPRHETHPAEQFKLLLKNFTRHQGKDDACKIFDRWYRAVEAATRGA